jgi:putative transposase
MRRIDELHLNYPFAGSQMLRDLLWQQELEVGRRHVRKLMLKMAIEAIYRRPNMSKPAPGHRLYPYLLRGLAIQGPTRSVPWT